MKEINHLSLEREIKIVRRKSGKDHKCDTAFTSEIGLARNDRNVTAPPPRGRLHTRESLYVICDLWQFLSHSFFLPD